MVKEIRTLYNQILKPLNFEMSEVITDFECSDYLGHNFKINDFNIKFRKSKRTPKKTGQFVTLWKRDPKRKTIPFQSSDNFQFYIICTEENENTGFFIFPKMILEKHQVLTSNGKEGKRGFRVYTDWHFPENKQAEKTKQWQTKSFLNYSNSEKEILEKFKKILELK